MGQSKQKEIKKFEQTFKYNDAELGVIKGAFSDTVLIFAIRKVFLQGELNETEVKIIKGLSEGAINILQREILPEIDLNAPLMTLSDAWATIDFSGELGRMALNMADRQICIDYLTQQFGVLKGETKQKIFLRDMVYNANKTVEQNVIELSARNSIIKHIDTKLNFLRSLAGQKSETVEELKERMRRDSNR